METTRRDFFKIAAVGGAAATVFGFDLKPAYAQLRELKIARATETRSTCPYCAVGCGVLIYTIGDRAKNVTPQVIHVEGDPDHPTNRGTLCPKGAALLDFVKAPTRLTKPRYRGPGESAFKDISWDEALDRIARLMKDDRDKNFVTKNKNGLVVNRWLSTGFLAASASANEAAWITYKVVRGAGILTFDNQARV